jgi:hypothetical protein
LKFIPVEELEKEAERFQKTPEQKSKRQVKD